MLLAELHQDETARRKEYPVVARSIYLANAAVCSMPRRVADAIQGYARASMTGNQEELAPENLVSETRRLSAELLGCTPADIALVGPTSVALSLIANGLKFLPGQNVVYCADDYPSNTVVWMNLEKRGVEIRNIVTDEPGHVTRQHIERIIDANTRLVALSSAHFVSGYRINIEEIGKFLRSCGILFSVDGIQTVGAVKTPTKYVDFLAADAHKWLLGPCAAGILYVHPAARRQLEPTLLGWLNVDCPDYLTPDAIRFSPDAERYEAGSPNFLGLVGLKESLDIIHELGPQAIEETIFGHTMHLRAGLRDRFYELASSDDDKLTGITSFRKNNVDMEALHQKLRDNFIITSLRVTKDGKKWIRLSPHYFNTVVELKRTLELL